MNISSIKLILCYEDVNLQTLLELCDMQVPPGILSLKFTFNLIFYCVSRQLPNLTIICDRLG